MKEWFQDIPTEIFVKHCQVLKENEERTSRLLLEGCNQHYSLLHTGANSKKDCWNFLELDKWSPQEYANYNIIIYRLKLGFLKLNVSLANTM